MLVTCNRQITFTVFAQELLGKDGVFLYPTFIDCANFHLEIFYKLFNVTYTLIMNALEVPVTNCPVGMNGQGLPIGIQVVLNNHLDSSHYTRKQGASRHQQHNNNVTILSLLPAYHCVTGLRGCYCETARFHSGKDRQDFGVKSVIMVFYTSRGSSDDFSDLLPSIIDGTQHKFLRLHVILLQDTF